jgi:hypothetical protein
VRPDEPDEAKEGRVPLGVVAGLAVVGVRGAGHILLEGQAEGDGWFRLWGFENLSRRCGSIASMELVGTRCCSVVVLGFLVLLVYRPIVSEIRVLDSGIY